MGRGIGNGGAWETEQDWQGTIFGNIGVSGRSSCAFFHLPYLTCQLSLTHVGDLELGRRACRGWSYVCCKRGQDVHNLHACLQDRS